MTAHQTASADALSDVQSVVIDTNIVLDLWVYQDPATPPLLQALQAGQLKWLATVPMREELLRVLDYPHIANRRAQEGLSAQDVWTKFDDLVHLQEVAKTQTIKSSSIWRWHTKLCCSARTNKCCG